MLKIDNNYLEEDKCEKSNNILNSDNLIYNIAILKSNEYLNKNFVNKKCFYYFKNFINNEECDFLCDLIKKFNIKQKKKLIQFQIIIII